MDSSLSFVDSARESLSSVADSIHVYNEQFFDECSSATKGRYRVNDARDFDAKTLHIEIHPTVEGISLLMGCKSRSVWTSVGKLGKDEPVHASSSFAPLGEKVVTILFDRSKFSEAQAKKWWDLNKQDPLFCTSSVR